MELTGTPGAEGTSGQDRQTTARVGIIRGVSLRTHGRDATATHSVCPLKEQEN